MHKKVFISYKWGTEEHNLWVERLYKGLRYHGVDARLDKYEVAPRESFSEYMTRGVREVDHVIFIVNDAAVRAVESGAGALAFEMVSVYRTRVRALAGVAAVSS